MAGAAEVVIVGASASGLATAACLDREGVPYVLLEQAPQVGAAWRAHYHRLHLHTPKGSSALPFRPFAREVPRYPSRLQVIEYLEQYAAALKHPPRLGEGVTAIRRDGDAWITETAQGRHRSAHVVIATGYTRVPHSARWKGQNAYQGEVLHSSRYTTGERYRGKRVLIIGFGNSAGEIAIDLHEHGAQPTLAVRGPVNVIARDLFGMSIMTVAALMRPVPPRLGDLLAAPLGRLAVGDITKLGLRKLPYGPAVQVTEHGQIPFIDIGTLALIRAGHVAVRGGVEAFTEHGVRFLDGSEERFDAVIVATGYRPRVDELLPGLDGVYDADGRPRKSGDQALPGLWFCGFKVGNAGMLREIGDEAKRIARGIRGARRQQL